MDKFHSLTARRAGALAVALLAWLAVLALLSRLCGYDPFGTSAYNTYTLQALAWREGRTWLSQDYPHLELAIFGGRYYVSFPPVPSVPLFLLSFFCGANTPDGLLVKLYALGAFSGIYWWASRRVHIGPALFWASAFVFASSLLPLMLIGAVWYQAQLLAFLCTVLAVLFAERKRPTPSLILYALAVGCRPFNAVAGLAVAALLWHRRVPWKKWIPGVCAGLAIGLCYGLYNLARFGSFFEFGHNYLPEFTRSEHGQFSLAYFWDNAKLVFTGMPFVNGQFAQFGFNLFLANPIFLLLAVWVVADIVRRRIRPAQVAALVAMAAQLFLLMLHKSFGGFQFGLRYTADLIPCALAYFVLSGRHRRVRWGEAALMAAALAFFAIGALCVHI